MASDSEPEAEVPPAKRRRAETVPDEIKKHETLYFEDGDIVLMSLPKDHLITAFRVDRVFLSRHSPVFKDMFSLPSPDNVEKYDDVPLVRLQDEADHLVSFLNALYDPSTIPYERHHPATVGRVEGTLKLCTKYQIDGLRKRIISQLLQDWPNNLDLWDIAEKEISTKVSSGIYVNDSGKVCNFEPGFLKDEILPEPCSVIRLARECEIPELLPAAFYHLSRIPYWADPDDPNSPIFLQHVRKGGRSARFALLSRDDLMCVLRGSQSMATYVQGIIRITLRTIRDRKCKSAERCEKLLSCYSKQLEIDIFRDSDPFATLSTSKIKEDIPNTICSSCRMIFEQAMHQGRSDMWTYLPVYFGFDAPD